MLVRLASEHSAGLRRIVGLPFSRSSARGDLAAVRKGSQHRGSQPHLEASLAQDVAGIHTLESRRSGRGVRLRRTCRDPETTASVVGSRFDRSPRKNGQPLSQCLLGRRDIFAPILGTRIRSYKRAFRLLNLNLPKGFVGSGHHVWINGSYHIYVHSAAAGV